MVKNLPTEPETQETQVWSLGQEDPLKEEMATHSSILPRKIPWIEEPGGLQSIASQRDTNEAIWVPSILWIWETLSTTQAGNFKPLTQGAERWRRKSVGRQVRSYWNWHMHCNLHPWEERCWGDMHSHAMTPPSTQADKSHQKIQSEIPFKESLSSTVLFPREDKMYILPVINHKPLEASVREVAQF